MTRNATLKISLNRLVCTTCGSQYENSFSSTSITSTFVSAADLLCPLDTCRICDDPRQFVPPSGQSFTTLELLWKSEKYRNVFEKVKEDEKVIEMWTEPKFGIGQRACIIQTPNGNVMWDLVAYLDTDTVDKINALGGLTMIIISHPHFYTTSLDWAQTFSCPVYMSSIDGHEWLNRPPSSNIHFIPQSQIHTEILPGLTIIQAGGHFPGSMMLHSSPPNTTVPSMFVADTIMSTPSASNPQPKDPSSQPKYFVAGSGIASYTFMWSIPNMIPLDPEAVLKIWRSMKDFDFVATYGVFAKTSVVREIEGGRDKGLMSLRERVLESMKIFVTSGGWKDAAILREEA